MFLIAGKCDTLIRRDKGAGSRLRRNVGQCVLLPVFALTVIMRFRTGKGGAQGFFSENRVRTKNGARTSLQ